MLLQERMPTNPSVRFPTRTRKYVHLTVDQATESMIYLLQENPDAGEIESEGEETSFIKAKLGGALGVTVNIRVLPEGSITALDLSFSYKSLVFIAPVIVASLMALGLVFQTPVPLLGITLTLVLAYRMNYAATGFLETVNEALPHLEQEYARRALMEELRRWQLEPKDTEALYRRLREKHTKTWGNTNVLEYKLAEYQRQGLTRDEAIRKTAEEEAIY